MTITKHADVGTAQISGSGALSQTVGQLVGNVIVGDFVAVWCAQNGTAVQNSLSDGLGNAYTKVLQASSNGALGLWVCYSATTTGGPTYTLTDGTNFADLAVSASTWFGLAGTLDQTASATGTTTALSTGTTPTTTSIPELVLAGFGVHGGAALTTTTPSGFSVLSMANTTTGEYYVFPFFEVINAIGTQNAASTLSATPTTSFSIIATFPGLPDTYPAGYGNSYGAATGAPRRGAAYRMRPSGLAIPARGLWLPRQQRRTSWPATASLR